MKKWTFIIISFTLSGCWPCNTITIENGPLPDSALMYIPYVDGETYKFKHSDGLVINYITTRKTLEERSSCTECCKFEHVFEINHAALIPDYPIFNLYFQIDNRDTINYHCYATIGKYGFYIPTNNEYDINYFEKVDSVKIGASYYYQVFKLKSYIDNYYITDSIRVDSLYYNYDYGVLKILMSNGENYTIYK